jgi:hypothetical protein
MAYVVPYLLGGLTAFLVSEFVPFSSAAGHLSGAMQSEHAVPAQLRGTPGSSVNRTSKGNRNAASRTAVGNSHIATVEVVGLRDTAIVYRDRDGRELFRTDPMNNVTLVTKGLHLPEVTVRQHSSSAVKPVPVRTLHEQNQVRERKPAVPARRKVPVGCEPLFSPVASPSLSHHAGRCMAELDIASGSLG